MHDSGPASGPSIRWELLMPLARAALVGAFVFAVVILVGCDGVRTADISGAVKFEGQPIDDGAIAFYPADGKGPSMGGPIKNGQYSTRVPLGAMKVSVSWPKGNGVKKKLYENDPKSPVLEMKSESL